ncbi:MAG: hypothetical protein ACKVZ0_15215 [Gemmatimonadales bacterium]
MRKMLSALRTGAPVLLTLLAACSQDASNPVAPAGDPSAAGSPQVAAQHLANLRAIETERQASNARFGDLMNAWNNRHQPGGALRTASNSPFVPCAPLPFDGEAQVVGVNGGTFNFGPHQLVIPAGAVTANVAIGVMVVTSLKTEVTLLPHGTQFAAPIKVKLAYGHCENATTHRVAYIDALGNIVEWPAAIDRPDVSIVEASLNHFSQYAIAY